MAWERRGPGGNRYYYRSVWQRGRVRKIYVGKGPAAEQAAREDQEKQAARAAQQYATEIERALEKPARDLMAGLDSEINVAIRSALMAAGFHQHARGQWRRKRHGKASEATKQANNGK